MFGPSLLALHDVLLLLLSVLVGVGQPEVVQIGRRVLPIHLDRVFSLAQHPDTIHPRHLWKEGGRTAGRQGWVDGSMVRWEGDV